MKLITLAFVAGWLFVPGRMIVYKWAIEKNSTLSIEGKSNVNVFRCDVAEYLRADTIEFYKDEHYQQFFTARGGPVIYNNRFDCHQRYITADLKKTLKADEGSTLKINLLSMDSFTVPANAQKIKGTVQIDLAGITRKMDIDFTVKTDEAGMLHLCGYKTILFSDFGLVPPSKLAGLIRVQEQLNVTFHLVLRLVQTNIREGNS